MYTTLNLYKNPGETPLECLTRFKAAHPEYAAVKMTYAGRLDPLAEGVLLTLAGEECKKKDQYLGLPKEYEFEVLFGVETDTGDVLGKVIDGAKGSPIAPKPNAIGKNLRARVEALLPSLVGTLTQEYPAYSSKAVGGKALWDHSRQNTLGDIAIPTREVEIYSLEAIGESYLSRKNVLTVIAAKIAPVHGDFRQQEILARWQEVLSQPGELPLMRFRISCSSGTYVRSLAARLGQMLGCSALAFHILRTRAGNHLLKDSLL